MNLTQKGATAEVGRFEELEVNMHWTTAADFDLAVVYETTKGTPGLVYFGDRGKLNEFPYIGLSGDQGVNDQAGDKQESLSITKLDGMKKLWILVWDYGQVQKGNAARFTDSDIQLHLQDDNGKTYQVALNTGGTGNVAVIATIDNTDPLGPRLINTSKTGTLNGLKKLQQLLDIIQGYDDDPDMNIDLRPADET